MRQTGGGSGISRLISRGLGTNTAWRLLFPLWSITSTRTSKIPEFFQKAGERGMDVLHLPIPDYGIPSDPEEDKYRPLIEDVAGRLEEGQTVVVHCRGASAAAGWLRPRSWWPWDIFPARPSGSCVWPARARWRPPTRRIASAGSRWSFKPGVARAKKIRLRTVTFGSFISVCLLPVPYQPERSSDQSG